MDDKNLNCSNEAVKKIIGNITAERQNHDGQYVPLGFTAPTASNTENINWNQQPNYINHLHPGMEQFPNQQFGFLPQNTHMFDYKNFAEPEAFGEMENGILEPTLYDDLNKDNFGTGLYERDYRLLMPLQQNHSQPETVHQSQNPTQFIEHLVGNWMGPNNSGTYSPFGNTSYYKPKVFESERDLNLNQIKDETKFKSVDEDIQFHFNRDSRKPRIVAEVKPMRPSYSDVLTKPVPQTSNAKITKNELKETKMKKENKAGKEKEKKVNTPLIHTNTNPDIKEVPADKNSNTKVESSKNNQFRKWASMDNIANSNGHKSDESKKKKSDEKSNKIPKQEMPKKINKTINIVDLESETNKFENMNVSKNGIKKINKPSVRPKSNDSFGGNERPPGKRNQRTRKKENNVPFGVIGQKLKQYTKGWWKFLTAFILWLINLISDVFSLSMHIIRDIFMNCWQWMCLQWIPFVASIHTFLQKIHNFPWIPNRFKKKKDSESEDSPNFAQNGLQNNINMPTTGEEAMKRLLACKGKDPYSILGVTPTCTDDDIKRYYKRQAFLVHPDKNNQPGAEEAFKILVHAFGMIGETERRAAYDRGVVESAQVVQAWTELTELLQQLQQKVEAAANTIRCSACGLRHKRVKIDRPSYAARNCNTCKIHHAAREGDIWAEAKVFGFLWHYYACMEGAVYDITEWAGCQKESLKHLRPDSHHVQYRIALGKQNNQPKKHAQCAHSDKPDLENLINSLYGQNENVPGTRNRRKKANK